MDVRVSIPPGSGDLLGFFANTSNESGLGSVRVVDPTRTVRLYVTFDNRRTLYAEATATLDRPRTVRDLRRITTTIVKAYADQPPLPTPSAASESTSP